MAGKEGGRVGEDLEIQTQGVLSSVPAPAQTAVEMEEGAAQ